MADLDSFREDIRSWLVANAPKSLVGRPVGISKAIGAAARRSIRTPT
jgi:hypothetical protein